LISILQKNLIWDMNGMAGIYFLLFLQK